MGIILPEEIYETASEVRINPKSFVIDWNSISDWEIELIEVINKCRLA